MQWSYMQWSVDKVCLVCCLSGALQNKHDWLVTAASSASASVDTVKSPIHLST